MRWFFNYYDINAQKDHSFSFLLNHYQKNLMIELVLLKVKTRMKGKLGQESNNKAHMVICKCAQKQGISFGCN